MSLSLAIVGHGFVGEAVSEGFSNPSVTKFIIDPKFGTELTSLPDKLDVVFVCVPTPMSEDGSVDTSILDSVIPWLVENINALIVVKSTVTPDWLKKWDKYIVYNPEFLTEKNHIKDFIYAPFHIFGGSSKHTNKLERYYHSYSSCVITRTYHMTAVEASLIKYGINSFLASKVAWFNEYYNLVETVSPDSFQTVLDVIGADNRIGKSHTKVPGPDGKRGFGGACFTKDVAALLKFASQESVSLSILDTVKRSNDEIRLQYTLDDREKEQHIHYDKSS